MVDGIGGAGNMVGSLFGGMDQMQQARGQQKQQLDPEMLKKMLEEMLAGASGGQGGGAEGGGNDPQAEGQRQQIQIPQMNSGQVNFM
ncbi:hypothetical protein HX871_25155 [Pseudomonas reactans]|jgi:hypothetical protein|uniref:Uncharacterized protein n=1 Tax=Pseudomonas reactans TaxID=117680 RepID=A0ABX2R1F3_9PSED|nr:hypothetical protein [Pseudomonas reactans]NWA44521.1 hypothetical protein [Pseudomonas reactans]NWD97727.1 hypothetical protein [Pseudomonas reactans]